MTTCKHSKNQCECEDTPRVSILLLASAYDRVEPTGQTAYHDGSTIKKKFISTPLGLYRVAAFTEEACGDRIKVQVMDPMLHGMDAITHFILTLRPVLIGFSPIRILFGGDRGFMEQVYQFSASLPGYRPLFVAGGIDASTAENDLFRYLPWLDLIISGYGEKVLPDILRKCFEKNAELDLNSLQGLDSLPGIITPRTHHSLRPQVTAEEFHRFATYVGENIPYEVYWAYNRQVNPNSLSETPVEIARVFGSNFCPYDCPFCAHQEDVKQQHGQRLFLLSPDELLGMAIRLANNARAKGMYFNDDNMFTSRSRVKEFLQLVIAAKASGRLPKPFCFYGQTRVDSVDDDILALAGQAGFVYISYGIESFSDEALASCDLRKRFTADQARVAVQRSLRHIPISNVNLILFYPSVTRRAFIETVEEVYRLLCYSLERGNKLSVNPFLTVEAYPQAPINTVAKERSYSSQGRWVADANGETAYLPESYLPLDAEFRRLVETELGRKSLILREAEKLFTRFRQDPRWPRHTISRSIGVNGLMIFIAAYELLRIDSTESRISTRDMEDLIFKLIWRFERENHDGTNIWD